MDNQNECLEKAETAKAANFSEPTFEFTLTMSANALNEEPIERLREYCGVDEETLRGCAATLELISRYGFHFDEELLDAVVGRLPTHVVNGWKEANA